MLLELMTFVILAVPQAGDEARKQEGPKPRWQPQKIELAAVIDDAKAKELAGNFKKAWRKAKDPLDQMAVLDSLGEARHARCAAELEKIMLKNNNPSMRSHAARLLVRTATPKSEKALLKAIFDNKNRDEKELLRAAGITLGRISKAKIFSKKFERKFNGLPMGAKAGVTLMVGYHKDASALEKLALYLDEPRPANVNSASNPPASYWRTKVAEYHYIKDEVIWAMWRISGKIFESRAEFLDWHEAWLKEQRKKKRRRR